MIGYDTKQLVKITLAERHKQLAAIDAVLVAQTG